VNVVFDELRLERDRLLERVKELNTCLDELSPTDGPCVSTYREFMAETVGFEWLVGGLLARQTVTMLVADPGLGKSTLMAELSLSLATGRAFLNCPATAPAKVLMLQAEGSRAAFRHRVQTAQLAMGVTEPATWFIQAPHFFDFQIGSRGLERLIKDSGAELAILDTIGYFARFKENDAEEWREKVMVPLRKLIDETGVSIILVHHQPKITDANKEAREGRGSGAMLGDVDHFWKLEKVRDEKDQRELVIRKNKYGAEPTIRLAFDKQNALFRVIQ
jgi:RecA-family ATPase